MDLMKKNHLLYKVFEKSKTFFRPFFDNGSSLTTEGGHRQKVFEPIYAKSRNNKGKDGIENIR